MHTISNRIFAISSILFNAVTVLLIAISCLTYIYERKTVPCNLQVVSVLPVSTQYYGRNIIFKPNIDLTDTFHLNVKQVFLYLKMKRNNHTEMVWSRIIQKDDLKKIYSDLVNNYRFFSIEESSNLAFELRGCIFPYVGFIQDKLFGYVEKKVTVN